jgi:glycerophosphoryl diester phosphodiesterase
MSDLDVAANPAERVSMAPNFHICGHRGARGLWPENTLEGFAGTFALGVDSVELDVGLTADGIPVVVHDPALNGDIVRGPDGEWLGGPGPLVRNLTYADLRRYDVGRLRPGSAYAAQFPAQRPHDRARIPALADVLALARPTSVVVDIEMKTMPDRPELTAPPERMVDAVLALVASQGMEAQVVLRSFDWRALHYARRVAPSIRRAYITSAGTETRAALWWGGADPMRHGRSVPATVAASSDAPGTLWAPAARTVTGTRLREATALGLVTMPWTVNESADMVRLIDMGVAAICTDYPDRLQALLADADQRPG